MNEETGTVGDAAVLPALMMTELVAQKDWSQTVLGARDTWSASLQLAVDIVLSSGIPMALRWGPQFTLIYNDAYQPILGDKHPWALGLPASEAWAEVWPQIEPLHTQIMSGQRSAVFAEDMLLRIQRFSGQPEDAHFTLSYSPVTDTTAPSGIGGIFVTAIEITERLKTERAARDSQAALEIANANLSAERAQFADLFEQAPGFMCLLSGPDHVFEYMNPAYHQLTGHRNLVGRPVREAMPEIDSQGFFELLDQVYRSGEAFSTTNAPIVFQNTAEAPLEWRFLNFVYQPIKDAAGAVTGIFVEGFDVTENALAERRRAAMIQLTDAIRDLETEEEIAFAAATILGDAMGVSRVGYGFIDAVKETLTVHRDWTAPGVESLAGTLNLRDYGSFIDDLRRGEFIAIADVEKDDRTREAAEALKARSAWSFVNFPMLRKGQLVAVLFVNHAERRTWSKEDLALFRDLGERTRTTTERAAAVIELRESEARLRALNDDLEAAVQSRTRELLAAEEALRQSQKMEAVGQLTGGIAHDFNNLLVGISGSLELLQKRLNEGRVTGLERYISTAQESAHRAAALTQRLLAFARRQTLDPRSVDANRMIAGMADLLDRSVGPNVNIDVVQAIGLWTIKVDPSQLENALLNLCINARDAMAPDGGSITIETANTWLDERMARSQDLPPGQYISLCVTDTGSGMEPDVIAKAFDPFFTTKPLGQGTGLGLSMIYGFVRQSGGQVRVSSDVGKGTTMCLYLPRYLGADDANNAIEDHSIDPGAGETVLIVDDEPAIRMLVAEVLSENGYHIIEAEDGASGLKVLQSEARIDLLVTDVGLPGGLNGRQMADAARATRPALRVLFITGFAENAVVGNGHLDTGMSVITKPFAMSALANKVRELIDA
jgi:signal transduction histidine kinase/PAS domain-containing protein